jgi:hypothetical protein
MIFPGWQPFTPPLVVPAAKAGEGIADRACISVCVPKLSRHAYCQRRQVCYLSLPERVFRGETVTAKATRLLGRR